MNEETILKILRRRKPNGSDLGRLAFFIDMLSLCEKRQNRTFKSIETMRRYLGDHLQNLDLVQAEVYTDFSCLYNIVHTYNYLGQGYYQQALRCFYRIMLIVGSSPMLAAIESMKEEFDIENVRYDVRGFISALKKAFSVDLFLANVEEKFELSGLKEIYGVFDTLDQCVLAYNDVVNCLKQKQSQYKNLLDLMPIISEKDYVPSDQKIKDARKLIRNVSSFRGKNMTTEFYDAYLGEK